MGPGSGATPSDCSLAENAGRLLAAEGHMILTGGRNSGVMEAAMKGAKKAGGTTIGILPSSQQDILSDYVDIPILTDMGNARNAINVLSSNVIVAIGTGPGTTSEVALSIKSGKPVILMNLSEDALRFFHSFDYGHLYTAEKASDLPALVQKILS